MKIDENMNDQSPELADPALFRPARGNHVQRQKRRSRSLRQQWAPARRWMPLAQAVTFLGVTASAQRKWLERATRDERGVVRLPGDVIAEKRGRLWFIGFPA